jgi:urease accessory protein
MMPLLRLLHLCDSLFPIGSFGYSDGLESAVASGEIDDIVGLERWLEICGLDVFRRSDGPAVAMTWTAIEHSDWDLIVIVDEEITALRSSSDARRAMTAMGRRLLMTWRDLYPDERLDRLCRAIETKRSGPALPVVFGAVTSCSGIALDDSLASYAYTRVAAIVSAAMRLVPIGQTDAHRLLGRCLGRVPTIIDEIVATRGWPESFTPALDIAQMTHQYVHSRLFRS